MKSLSLVNKIRLYFASPRHTYTHKPYKFGDDDGKCCIAIGSTRFCEFEDITINSGSLFVGHFSVNDSYRGNRIGEICLRKFAAHIALLDPHIKKIELLLYRLPTNSPHKQIAQARLDLLKRIGASNTSITALPQGKFEVRGSWEKNNWK